ncbi:hypothetical protein KAH81_10335, partial [bacterium]|nr:hypothetical protein [bacterium]
MRLSSKMFGVIVVGIAIMLAASPGIGATIHYQGKLTDIGGVGINDELPMKFRFYDAETDGDSLWGESYEDLNEISVVHGFFDVMLGSVNPIEVPFDEQYWLEIEIDGNILIPRMILSTSPYSFSATVAESVQTGLYLESVNAVSPDSITGNIELVEGTNIEIIEIPDSNKIRISSPPSAPLNPLIVGNVVDPGELQIAKGGGVGNRVVIKGNAGQPGVVVNQGDDDQNGIEAEAAGAGNAIKARNDDLIGFAAKIIGNLIVENSLGGEVFKVDAFGNRTYMSPTNFNGNGAGESSLEAEATGTDGTGLTGTATSTTGSGNGLIGVTEACGDSAAGVKGIANCVSGMVYGVKGISSGTSDGSAGIYGVANSESGMIYGVTG